ncbi:DNA mismatch repair protein MutS [Paenibacillus protaetiae]|uniref:DNA mismatch repair protein MutS n=1 Tax=Paenibacillus protaetiae TaxID=2509456 RepID=A0A4V0YF08_9BACL|nr:DNA mismatch repair protein MutS [Paenibacillus protaetiae]QAY66061.1 DNA mismatch repair protein MutS [Paenibacillus protaetiae]
MAGYTPMIQQYLSVKEQAKDAFLFFRLGDFYEMFFEDAVAAARELEITLTGRDGGMAEKIPMCGVPYHSADNYIARLVEKGYKVAICEQVEDPSAAKGVVRREIVRVITPGTVMESKSLADKSNNFIVSVAGYGARFYGIAACDLSTGELYVTSVVPTLEALLDEINVYEPSEMVGEAPLLAELQPLVAAAGRPVLLTPREPAPADKLAGQFGHEQLAGLAAERLAAVSLLTGYLDETQKRSLHHVRTVRTYETNQYMVLDNYTRRNLELTETVRDRSKKGSLLSLLDRTQTSMGARLLRRWIDKPLLNAAAIEARLEAVDTLYRNLILREDIRTELKEIYDLERLVGRVAFGSANGRDMNALKNSLLRVPQLAALSASSGSATLAALVRGLDTCADIAEAIDAVIVDEPPVSVREGGLIRGGCDPYLDQLREASTNGKRWLAELERQEREATGIKSLKIGYNKVFGYYLEVTKANLPMLPEGRYERKQTLASAERFVTPELKEKERLILEAEEKMVDLEYEKFLELRDHVALHLSRLQKLAETIAALDVYQSLALVSAERRYAKPSITEGYNLKIEEGRHPVVESVMEGAPFITNSASLTQEDHSMLLITGPNMAGKSTYMRQVALIVIMAQIGCFVPAKGAEVPLVDRIFTRIGAADDLIGGQSTFMVEMKDIQIMTEKATRDSLVIIDELGRGTSTSEGMAIAQAVIEFVHHHIGCKALVSTHFHELSHLEESLPSLANACMAVEESGDHVTFLRKLIPGAASTSYGIYCARLAGLPESVIGRAYELLDGLEQQPEEKRTGAGFALKQPEAVETVRETAAAADLRGAEANESRTAMPAEALREAAAGLEAPAAVRRELPVSADAETNRIAGGQPSAASAGGSNPFAGDRELHPTNAKEIAGGGFEPLEAPVQLSIFAEAAVQADTGKRKASDPKAEQLAEQLRKLDLFNMTPLEAMQWLNDMKRKFKD